MLELYYAPMTRAIRIRWLLEELGLPYALNRVAWRDPSDGFEQATPLGKIPVLRDGDVVLAESGAIVEYVCEHYGEDRLSPPVGDPKRGAYLQWMHFAEGTLGPPMGPVIFHTRYAKDADARGDLVDVWRERSRRAFRFLEDQLADGRTFVLGGSFSAADVMLGYSVAVARVMNVLDEPLPAIDPYFERLTQRPAFQRATAD